MKQFHVACVNLQAVLTCCLFMNLAIRTLHVVLEIENEKMNQSAVLVPFCKPSQITAMCQVAVRGGCLELTYSLKGSCEQLDGYDRGAFSSSVCERKDHLWEQTCLEAFLADESKKDYWEMNVSLSGDWNIFCFSDYRQARTEENRSQVYKNNAYFSKNEIYFSCLWDLMQLDIKKARIGISMIANYKDGQQDLLALAHDGAIADFHKRSSFLLNFSHENGVWL